MYSIIQKFVLLSILFMGTAQASEINDSNATERIGFFVRGLKICHQGEWRNMTVFLEYESDLNAFDVLKVKNFVRQFLEKYDNAKDYWEVMNIKLVRLLVKEFPSIYTLKAKLSLAPDRTLFFPRESTVEYARDREFLKETFMFTKLKYLICNETFKELDLQVAFNFKENPQPADYPDYRSVDAAMEEFFAEQPVSLSKWSLLKPQLEGFLLKRFPSFSTIDVSVKVAK